MSKTLELAYRYCRKIALGHYENFPVGSLLVPRRLRGDFYALYAFMRTADDLADDTHRAASTRLALLQDWRRQLDEALVLTGPEPDDPIFVALRETVRRRSLDPQLLYALLDAFESDARGVDGKGSVRFADFAELRGYTSRSAEPVGRLVLALFDYCDAARISRSDDICTALQLLNFIQDAKADLDNDRCYFPMEDLARFGISGPAELLRHPKREALMLEACDRVESLLARGAGLPEEVRGRLRYELRAVILGAQAMLAKIRLQHGDVFTRRPALTNAEHRRILMRSLIARPLS